jgi:outer membrane protein OmpA-like peptidoglycan-associated protein
MLFQNTTFDNISIRFTKGSTEIWIFINAYVKDYYMTIVERQAMQQEVTLDVTAMANELDNYGRVAVYGIHFDTGKSELKPDSEAALVEITKLLKQKPALKVYVVGHTDMVADLGYNLKLSQERAQAVVKALVFKFGIDPARLIPFGNGPYAPVASNRAEDGRFKNRRVELVEIAGQ